MRYVPTTVVAVTAAVVVSAAPSTVSAQTPPPPGAVPAPPPPGAPPPPPVGPDGPPPPPRGASIEFERGGPNGMRLVVRCAESDATKECAEIATSLLDKVNASGTAR